jgi:hypothetical protein
MLGDGLFEAAVAIESREVPFCHWHHLHLGKAMIRDALERHCWY